MVLALVLAIFFLTYALLIFRKIRGRQIPIWVSMVVGAILMVATFSISPEDAFYSINLQVIGFLFGMLVITAGFEKSGLINYIVIRILKKTSSPDGILLAVIIGSGFLSAFLVNDTIALLWTPIVLGISVKIGLKAKKALLIPLAFGITIGSVFTPIGNPQNLLVAVNSQMQRPFASFVEFLAIPSIISLVVVYYFCRSNLFFGRYLSKLTFSSRDLLGDKNEFQNPSSAISDWLLAKESLVVLVLLLSSFAVVEVFPGIQSMKLVIGPETLMPTIGTLALVFGLILLIISPKREYILVSLSWSTLVFFVGMFVVMGAVWSSGVGPMLLSYLPNPVPGQNLQSTSSIMLVSILLSQVLSNVPFVQLYSYQMHALGLNGAVSWVALAAGSTIAGTLTVLGAVSNVIIISSAESRNETAFGFFEFMKYGALITACSAVIFVLFLSFV